MGLSVANRHWLHGMARRTVQPEHLALGVDFSVSDPTNILDVVIGAMDPNTWFDEAEYEIEPYPIILFKWVVG